MHNFLKIFLIFVICFAFSSTAFAVGSAGLVSGIWFSDEDVTDFGETMVYSVVHNQTDEQLQGIATLVVNGEAVGAQEVSVGKGNIKQIGILHQFSSGTNRVSMSFTAGNATEVTFTELAAKQIFVVKDTDGDGIQNTTDLDDDNDGIPDDEDSEPLVKQVFPNPTVDLSETGRNFLNKIVGRTNSTGEEAENVVAETEVEKTQDTSTSTVAIVEAFQTLEEARKKGATVLRGYEEERREKLEEITRAEDELTAVEGFEPTNAHESKKREHQLAAAGAATVGTVLEEGWLFYLHIIVLVLSVMHLVISWFKRRFANVGVDDEE